MARRTLAVEQQTTEAEIKSSANIKKRLIDFDTNSSKLEEQHKQWLESAARPLMRLAAFKVQLHGFASKQGSLKRNRDLSIERMNSVLAYLQLIDHRVISNAKTFEELGETQSTGSEQDDQSTAKWRAVEVHIFDQNPPPPEPPGKEVKPDVFPLPGGPRYQKWSVASPGGIVLAEYVGVGFNLVFIKNEETGERRGYLNTVVVAGASASIPKLALGWKIIQMIITGISFPNSKLEFTPVTPTLPVSWAEIGRSDVSVIGDTEGVTSNSHFFFNTIALHHGKNGFPVSGEATFDFISNGGGIGAGFIAGIGNLKHYSQLDKL